MLTIHKIYMELGTTQIEWCEWPWKEYIVLKDRKEYIVLKDQKDNGELSGSGQDNNEDC
jgi:hypothetical protein